MKVQLRPNVFAVPRTDSGLIRLDKALLSYDYYYVMVIRLHDRLPYR